MSRHGESFDRAQRAHDNAEPPEYWYDDNEDLIDSMTDDFISKGPEELEQISDWPDRFFELGFEIAHIIAEGRSVTYGPSLQQGYIDKELAVKLKEYQEVIRNHVRSIVAKTIREG